MRSVVKASEAEDWRTCARVSQSPRSLDVLYRRAWCVYSLGRPLEALAGFEAALGGGLDARAKRDAAYGMALAYLSLNAPDDAAYVAAAHDMTRKQRVEIESGVLDQRGVLAYEAGDYDRAIAYFDALEDLRGWLRRDLSMLRAYSYKHLGDTGRSHLEFRRVHNGMASDRTEAALRGVASVD